MQMRTEQQKQMYQLRDQIPVPGTASMPAGQMPQMVNNHRKVIIIDETNIQQVHHPLCCVPSESARCEMEIRVSVFRQRCLKCTQSVRCATRGMLKKNIP